MNLKGQFITFPQIKAWLATMPAEVFERAAISALNKTVAQARTAMSREIRAEFNLPASTVNAGLRIHRARVMQGFMSWEAVLESPSQRGRAMNLIHFAARQTKAGVSVKIKRGGARKVVAQAFIANKGRTVFQRTGKARLPIEPVQTVAVPQMFNAKRVNAKVLQFIKDKLPEVFEREAKYYMSRHRA
jgi:hypothetical protein